MSALVDLAPVIDRWIAHLCERGHSPGIAAAVVEGDEVVVSSAHGMRDIGAGLPMTADTSIPVASLTKPFVATTLLLLEHEGRLSLDDRVSNHLGRSFDFPITVRQLLTHTAGLSQAGPHHMDNDGRLQANEERPELVRPPDTATGYSNYGYHLAATVIEVITGKSLGGALDEHLFGPLDMTSTGFDRASDAVGYLHQDTVSLRRPGPPDPTAYTFPGAGGVTSTLDDLTKWLRAWTSETGALPLAVRQRALRTHWFQPETTARWGLGWQLHSFDGRDIAANVGHFAGFHHWQQLDLGQDQAVVVLTNAIDSRAAEWIDCLLTACQLARSAEGEPTSESVTRFTGRYGSMWDESVIVALGSRLLLINLDNSEPFSGLDVLEPESETELRIVDGSMWSPVGETVSFTFGANGEPQYVLYGPDQINFKGRLGSI